MFSSYGDDGGGVDVYYGRSQSEIVLKGIRLAQLQSMVQSCTADYQIPSQNRLSAKQTFASNPVTSDCGLNCVDSQSGDY